MGNIGKEISLLLVVILAISSLIMTESAFAQSIPKPSVPEFTLKYVDKSYDVPPKTTTTTDPYNGKITTTNIPGYHVKNFSIEVSIKNQPFPSTINGNKSSLWYDVQIKGHYGGDWSDQYPSSIMSPTSLPWPTQSSSAYTLLSFPASYRTGDEVDFQVKAISGYQYSYDTYFYGQQPHIVPLRINDFIHEESGWSNIRTITIADGSVLTSASSNPTPTPTVPEFSSWTIPWLFTVMVALASLLLYRKKQKQGRIGHA
jgi:hypothetical protein